jgi:hypothetical protein
MKFSTVNLIRAVLICSVGAVATDVGSVAATNDIAYDAKVVSNKDTAVSSRLYFSQCDADRCSTRVVTFQLIVDP